MWYILSTIFFIVFYVFLLRTAKYNFDDTKYKFSIGFYCIVIIVSMIPVVRVLLPIFYRLVIYEDMFNRELFYIPIFRNISNFFKIKV
jgi:hypothetical protein